MKSKPAQLSDFTPDKRNANKGTDRGRELLRESIRKAKAGRSILVDSQGRIIAGNKTREAAIAEGMKEAIVVETDGSQLVVVKRTDLNLETDEEAKYLAVVDNRSSEIGLEWEPTVLAELSQEIDLSGLWTENEWSNLLENAADQLLENHNIAGADDEGMNYEPKYAVAIECTDESHQEEVYNTLVAQGYQCKVLTL